MQRWGPNVNSRATIAALLVTSSCCSLSALAAERYPMNAVTVSRALEQAGFSLDPAQIQLPAVLTSASITPALVPYHVERARDGSLRVQLRCAKTGDCLAFTITVSADADKVDEMTRLVAGTQSSNTVRSTTAAPRASGSTPTDEEQPVIHPGQQLTMWLEDGHIRIHLPVVALDRGTQGMILRVSTSDRKSIFHAIVLDRNTVKGIVQ